MQAVQAALASSSIPFRVVQGVNGRGLGQRYVEKHNAANEYYRPLLDTEFGCYLSHIMCCKMIVEEGADVGVVLEDDVLIKEGFDAVISDVVNSGVEFDMVKLHGRKKGCVVVRELAHTTLVEYVPMPIATPAQLWSQRGAQKFRKGLEKRGAETDVDLDMRRPIDVDLRYPWEHGLTILSVRPDAVALYADHSTIGERRTLPRSGMSKQTYELRFIQKRFTYEVKRFGLLNAIRLELGATIRRPF